jgi:hypothetical protein
MKCMLVRDAPATVVTRRASPAESAGRRRVRLRSLGMCELCGVKPATFFHHRRNDRSWNPGNVVHACTRDRYWILRNPQAARVFGWSLRDDEDPELTACLIHGRGWVHLAAA